MNGIPTGSGNLRVGPRRTLFSMDFLPLQQLVFLLSLVIMKTFRLLLTILLVACSITAFAQVPEKIASINVIGNERIDKAYISNSIKTKEGEPYDIEKLRDDMRNIYKTGFFSDVQIDVKDTDKGKAVTFVIIERPPIKSIFIAGNKKVKTEDIRDKLKIKTNTVLNIERIKESMDEIRKLYASKAYYSTKVAYAVDYEEGASDVSVRFTIEEPEMAYVRKIAFTGNKTFKASKLTDYMRTKEKGFLSWFTGSGILDEEALDDDRKNVEAFYADNGYIRAKVGIPDIQLSKDGKSITITLPVEEGNVYKIGNVSFSGDVIFDRDELMKKLKSKSGNTFRSTRYHEDVLAITDLYQDRGYAFCEVLPLTAIDDTARKVDLTFDVSKGREIFISRINIIGNTKSRDKVIRREMRIAEGDLYSISNIRLSQKRLRRTQYFKSIDLKTVKTDEPDKINVDLTVEEKPTGTLSLGVGYSSTDSMILTGSVSQENFLGTGRKAYLTAALSGITQEFRFTYVEPYLLDRNVSAAFSLFKFTRYMDTYDYMRQGGSVTLSRPLTEELRTGLRYRLETVEVTNVDVAASYFIKAQQGNATTSSVTANLSKLSIDDILNPTKGVNADISFEFAGGPFAGDNEFYKIVAVYGRYFPSFWDSAFFVRGTAGAIRAYGSRDIPIYEKFYVGGLHTVRGFKYGEAGPIDPYTGEVLGGQNELFFNFEWIFPIYKPAGIKGVLFYDIGHGFDDNSGFLLDGVRHAAGTGIRWFSPLGPIRLELGFNLSPKPGERASVFDFAIGTQY
jgi:outer membrane protein insertion porin family